MIQNRTIITDSPKPAVKNSSPYVKLIELCLIFIIFFCPLAHGAVELWAIAVIEVTAALMAVLWIFKLLANGKIEFIRNPTIPVIFLFIGYVSLQLFLFSVYKHATKTELVKVISYILIFFITVNTIKTKAQIMRILSIIIAAGFLMSIFFFMRYFGVKAPKGLINPDHFSGYLGMVVPLALGMFFAQTITNSDISRATHPKTETAKQFLLFYSVIVMGAALFFTMSRGGMFSFVGALLFMAFLTLKRRILKGKRWILLAIVIFITLIIMWLGATPIIERILSIKVEIASRYFAGRLPIWQGTANIIKDFSLFGTGLGTFKYVFPKYQPLQIIEKHYAYAHSDFLELLSEVGIAGFSIFLLGLIVFIIYAFRRFRLRHDPYVIGVSIGIFGSLTSIFIHSFADFNLHIPANAILLTLILSLATVALNFKRDKFEERLDFRNHIFVFSKIYPVTDNNPWLIFREIFRISLYPLALILFGLYIFSALRPALADYYFRNAHDAIRDTQYAIRLDPTNALYHYELGKLYVKSNLLQDALVQYKKAVELNPIDGKYHQSLAWLYGQLAGLGKYNTQYTILNMNLARSEFQKAIELEPNNPYRHRTYAIWLFNHPMEEKNIEKGVVEYKKAVDIEPKLYDEALTNCHRLLESYEGLISVFAGTEENDYIFFRFLVKEKGLKFAIDFAEKFLKTYSYNAKIHFCIADTSFYDSDFSWEFTEEHYNIAFQNAPESAYYRMWHGIHLCHRGEYRKALKDLEMALNMGLDPNNEKEAKEYIAQCKDNMREELLTRY